MRVRYGIRHQTRVYGHGLHYACGNAREEREEKEEEESVTLGWNFTDDDRQLDKHGDDES
jgi:hypothetical protein